MIVCAYSFSDKDTIRSIRQDYVSEKSNSLFSQVMRELYFKALKSPTENYDYDIPVSVYCYPWSFNPIISKLLIDLESKTDWKVNINYDKPSLKENSENSYKVLLSLSSSSNKPIYR